MVISTSRHHNSSGVVIGLISQEAINDSEKFPGDHNQRLFGSFSLAEFSMVKAPELGIMFKSGDGSHINGFSEVFWPSLTHSWSGKIPASGFRYDREEAEITDEVVGGAEAVDVADFSQEYGGGFRPDSWNGSEAIRRGVIRGIVKGIGDRGIQGFDGGLQLRDLGHEGCEYFSSGSFSLAAIDGVLSGTHQVFSFGAVKIVTLKSAGDFFDGTGMNRGQVSCGGELLQDGAHDFGKRVSDYSKDFGEDHLKECGSLPAVGLHVFEISITQPDQVSQALYLVVGDVTASGLTRAQKACDDISVYVVGFGLFSQEFPVAVGLEGVQKVNFETLGFQVGQKVFPEMPGGFQTDDELFLKHVSFLQGGQKLRESLLAGVNGETVADFFTLDVKQRASVGFERYINSQIKHEAPFLSSTHGGLSSSSPVRIAWFVLSDEADKAPHNILNECSRPERRKATVYLDGSIRPKGGNQVVFPPRENNFVCINYKHIHPVLTTG